jgi:hypothetical protein
MKLARIFCVMEGHHWRYIKRCPLGIRVYRCTVCGKLTEKYDA